MWFFKSLFQLTLYGEKVFFFFFFGDFGWIFRLLCCKFG